MTSRPSSAPRRDLPATRLGDDETTAKRCGRTLLRARGGARRAVRTLVAAGVAVLLVLAVETGGGATASSSAATRPRGAAPATAASKTPAKPAATKSSAAARPKSRAAATTSSGSAVRPTATPVPPREISLTGELVETGCFFVGGRRGPHHRACPTRAQPIAIVDDAGVLRIAILDHRSEEIGRAHV